MAGNTLARLRLAILRHAVFHVEANAVGMQGEGFFYLVAVIAGDIEQGTTRMHALFYATCEGLGVLWYRRGLFFQML